MWLGSHAVDRGLACLWLIGGRGIDWAYVFVGWFRFRVILVGSSSSLHDESVNYGC